MIKSKLVKGMAIGLCVSALFAAAVSASTTGIAASFDNMKVVEIDSRLYDIQKEIDQDVFVKYADDIIKKGFGVVYTGIAESYVEVGILPYSKENADYLYDIIGSTDIRIVAGEEAKPYDVTEQAEDTPASNGEMSEAIIKDGEVSQEPNSGVSEGHEGAGVSGYTGDYDDKGASIDNNLGAPDRQIASYETEGLNAVSPDTPVSSVDDGLSPVLDSELIDKTDIIEDKAASEDGDFSIQIESVVEDADVKVVSAENGENAENSSNRSIVPTIIIFIAIAGVVIGSIVLYSKKQKQ